MWGWMYCMMGNHSWYKTVERQTEGPVYVTRCCYCGKKGD